jgi:hypothetical protein
MKAIQKMIILKSNLIKKEMNKESLKFHISAQITIDQKRP